MENQENIVSKELLDKIISEDNLKFKTEIKSILNAKMLNKLMELKAKISENVLKNDSE